MRFVVTMSIKPHNLRSLAVNLDQQSQQLRRYAICRRDDEPAQRAGRECGFCVLPIVSAEDSFASGHNRAMQQLEGDPVLISDDAAFIRVDGLARLSSSPHPITGALITSDRLHVNHTGVEIAFEQGELHFRHIGRDEPLASRQNTGYRECPAATFACVQIRREVWQRLGGLDESFRWEGEDIDFCLRARQLGVPTFVDTSCLVHHTEHGTRIPQIEMNRRLRSKWQEKLREEFTV